MEKKIFAYRAVGATWEQVVAVLSPFTGVGSTEGGVLLPVATCHGEERRWWSVVDLVVHNDTGKEWDEYVLLSEEETKEVEFTSLTSHSSIRARRTDCGWEVTLTLPCKGDVKGHYLGGDSPYYGAYAHSFAEVFGFPAVPAPAVRVRKQVAAQVGE